MRLMGQVVSLAQYPTQQKAAGGRPPVPPKNLRLWFASTTWPKKQKSRPVAVPRPYVTGTCEKPPTNRSLYHAGVRSPPLTTNLSSRC
jgi:hypothetical protein